MEKAEEEKWRDFECDLVKALLDKVYYDKMITSAEREAIEQLYFEEKKNEYKRTK